MNFENEWIFAKSVHYKKVVFAHVCEVVSS